MRGALLYKCRACREIFESIPLESIHIAFKQILAQEPGVLWDGFKHHNCTMHIGSFHRNDKKIGGLADLIGWRQIDEPPEDKQ
jgi:hypothetical protein